MTGLFQDGVEGAGAAVVLAGEGLEVGARGQRERARTGRGIFGLGLPDRTVIPIFVIGGSLVGASLLDTKHDLLVVVDIVGAAAGADDTGADLLGVILVHREAAGSRNLPPAGLVRRGELDLDTLAATGVLLDVLVLLERGPETVQAGCQLLRLLLVLGQVRGDLGSVDAVGERGQVLLFRLGLGQDAGSAPNGGIQRRVLLHALESGIVAARHLVVHGIRVREGELAQGGKAVLGNGLVQGLLLFRFASGQHEASQHGDE